VDEFHILILAAASDKAEEAEEEYSPLEPEVWMPDGSMSPYLWNGPRRSPERKRAPEGALFAGSVSPGGRLSVPIHEYGCIRAPLHPPRLRCAPSPYSPVRFGRSASSDAAHRRSRCYALFM